MMTLRASWAAPLIVAERGGSGAISRVLFGVGP
jgi:hypothetical protein